VAESVVQQTQRDQSEQRHMRKVSGLKKAFHDYENRSEPTWR
jgi:hypothetical protein